MNDILDFVINTLIPRLLAAIPITLALTFFSGLIGNLLAVPIAVARISPNPLLWIPSYLYILLMRGTPLLAQIYLIYYRLGHFLPHPFARPRFLSPYPP